MNIKKCSVDNLSVEITRRCNLKCKHCMRGEAECLDISYRDLDSLFSLIYEIYELYITGGEPSLCVPQVNVLHITGGEPSMNTSGMKKILSGLSSSKTGVDWVAGDNVTL